MEKKLKKRIKIHWISILLLIIFLICCYFGISYIIKVPTRNIYIKGNSILTDSEIMDITKLIDYPSYYTLPSYKISGRLKNNSIIKKVKVKKRIYPTFVIQIEEYIPLFINNETGKVVLENKQELELDNISLPRLMNYVPSDKYTSFINGLLKIDKDTRKLMSDIIYEPNEQDKDRFRILMNDGNTVYLTLTKFKQMNYYKDVVVKLEGKKGILYFDSGNHFQVIE
ncbi:MAG: FtsQ-type POTRA domain-containing protein [Bacilli bacterium]|nr:FtsQ-type POTRA domain-containing protein [Bacilli bacterium]